MSDELDDSVQPNPKAVEPLANSSGAPSPKPPVQPLFAELTNWRVVEIEGEASPVQEGAGWTRSATAAQPRPESPAPPPVADEADEVMVASIQRRSHAVTPGKAATYAVTLLNNGTRPSTFTAAVEGWVDQKWTVISPSHTKLQPGASATFEVTLTPPRLPTSQVGEYPFAVVFRSQAEPGRRTQVGALLTVEPLIDFTLGELRPSRLQSNWRRPTAHTIAPLTNHSNANLYVQIEGASTTADQRFEFATPGAVAPQIGRTSFVLTPGQTVHVACRITPESRYWAGLRSHRLPFRIVAQGALAERLPRLDGGVWRAPQHVEQGEWDASRAVQGVLSQAPLLGPGLMSALTGCMLTLLLGAGLTGLVVVLALLPSLRGQPTQPAPSASAPPAALEIVVKIAEPVPAVGAAQASEPPLAANVVTQGAPAEGAAPQPIVVNPVASAAQQPPAVNAAAILQPPTDGTVQQVTADQITQPGQLSAAPAVAQSGAGVGAGEAPVVQPNMISGPNSAAPQPEGAQGTTPVQPAAAPAVSTTTMTYEELFRTIAQQYNLDWRMLAAQAYVESSFNPLALGNKGDLGLMQVLPSTWKEWAPRVDAADPFDSYSNVLVAAAYLDYLRTTFASQGYPEPEWMLIAYNWGPNQVRNFLNGGGELSHLDESLQKYARDVLRIAESLPRE